jgi:hypothetical protein
MQMLYHIGASLSITLRRCPIAAAGAGDPAQA